MHRPNEGRFSFDSGPIYSISNQDCPFVYQLPDVVLNRNRDQKVPYAQMFDGIVLFADVSGFTELCEKYGSDVRRGVNQLANALNSYMALVVEAILREKGDVYKFAGDAVLGSLKHFHIFGQEINCKSVRSFLRFRFVAFSRFNRRT